MKSIRIISIISGRPEDCGRRIKLGLFLDGDSFRWFGGNPGEEPRPFREQDSEVSSGTVEGAIREAGRAWAGSNWGLRFGR